MPPAVTSSAASRLTTTLSPKGTIFMGEQSSRPARFGRADDSVRPPQNATPSFLHAGRFPTRAPPRGGEMGCRPLRHRLPHHMPPRLSVGIGQAQLGQPASPGLAVRRARALPRPGARRRFDAARTGLSSSARSRAIFARSSEISTSACRSFSRHSSCNRLSRSRSSRTTGSLFSAWSIAAASEARRWPCAVRVARFNSWISRSLAATISSVDRSTSSIVSAFGLLFGVVRVEVGFQRGENAAFLRFPVEPSGLPGLPGQIGRRRPGLGKLLLKFGVPVRQLANLVQRPTRSDAGRLRPPHGSRPRPALRQASFFRRPANRLGCGAQPAAARPHRDRPPSSLRSCCSINASACSNRVCWAARNSRAWSRWACSDAANCSAQASGPEIGECDVSMIAGSTVADEGESCRYNRQIENDLHRGQCADIMPPPIHSIASRGGGGQILARLRRRYFTPAMNRRNRASSIRQSLPKTAVKSAVRSAAVYSWNGGRAAVRFRYAAYLRGSVSDQEEAHRPGLGIGGPGIDARIDRRRPRSRRATPADGAAATPAGTPAADLG